MNIGIVSMYPFRPHVAMLYYLAELIRGAGHEVFFLSCCGEVPTCYARIMKRTNRIQECPACVLGGFHSFSDRNISRLRKKYRIALDEKTAKELTQSSSYTLCRTETKEDGALPEVINLQKELYETVQIVYGNTIHWINEKKIDCVLCFNGRLEMNRAILQACKDIKTNIICTESAMYGHGIEMIFNDNCQALWQFDQMIYDFIEKPLTKSQAIYAGHLISSRFLRKNNFEWRVFNRKAESAKWPIRNSNIKVLIVPSSRNEFEGHFDWKAGWSDYTVAIDHIIGRLKIDYADCVLRCHPIWAETIGGKTGEKSESYYREWAKRRGVHFIGSCEKTDTYDLIIESDLVLLSGGSPGIEAGACGKRIIQYGHSFYQNAGFTTLILGPEDLKKLDVFSKYCETEVIKRTMRFVYLQARRYPQYVDYIRAKSVSEREFYDGADPERLINLFRSGKLIADDGDYAEDSSEENGIVQLIKENRWDVLYNPGLEIRNNARRFIIQRRGYMRYLDRIRNKFPAGDRQ